MELNYFERYLADSNRRTRFCRPLPNHSAKVPVLLKSSCKDTLFSILKKIYEINFLLKSGTCCFNRLTLRKQESESFFHLAYCLNFNRNFRGETFQIVIRYNNAREPQFFCFKDTLFYAIDRANLARQANFAC